MEDFGIFAIICLLFGIFWAVCCGLLAKQFNRDPIGWSFAGFFIGLIALIFLVCAGKRQEKTSS